MSRVAARLVRNVAWLGVGEVVLKGAMFAAGVLVARGLGPAAMGAFTVSYGAAMMLMLLLTAGQVEVVIRETARRPETARGTFPSTPTGAGFIHCRKKVRTSCCLTTTRRRDG